MDVPLELTFHHMNASSSLEGIVRTQVRRLERYFDHINSCRVAIERPENNPEHHGRRHRYRVRVELGVPGEHLVVKRTEVDMKPNQDIVAAIRDAFHVLERRLKSYAERLSPQERLERRPPMGHIVMLNQDDGYGFIQAADGHTVYFHENSLSHGEFGELERGQEVHFREILAEAGPRATQVRAYKRDRHPDLGSP